MKPTRLIAALALALLASGCHLYFPDGDDEPCLEPGVPYPSPSERNPYTGICEEGLGGGGGGGCEGDTPVSPPTTGTGSGEADRAARDWASCYGVCEGLDETTCLAADGCRAVFAGAEVCTPEGCYWIESFAGCWGMAPSGGIRGEPCDAFDGYECSRHDDCIAVYDTIPGTFTRCGFEPGGCVSDPIMLRNPDTGLCESYGGGGCGPGMGAPLIAFPEWAACESVCSGYDEATCRAADGCRAAYRDLCPPWAPCVPDNPPAFVECWATAPAGPIHGDCAGLDAWTCSLHDDCTAEHTSIWNNCDTPGDPSCASSTGPFLACHDEAGEPPLPLPTMCEEVVDERECIEAGVCTPLYEGADCVCDESGCRCATWIFTGCTGA